MASFQIQCGGVWRQKYETGVQIFTDPTVHDTRIYLYDLSHDLLLAESVDDDVGGHSGHTQHSALGTPRHQLDGERILVHDLSVRFLLLAARFLEHLGRLELVQHLEHYCSMVGNRVHVKNINIRTMLQIYGRFLYVSPFGSGNEKTICGCSGKTNEQLRINTGNFSERDYCFLSN